MEPEDLRVGMHVRLKVPYSPDNGHGWVNGNRRTGEVAILGDDQRGYSVALSFPFCPDNWVSLDNLEPYA
jgi:hypothetical protein